MKNLSLSALSFFPTVPMYENNRLLVISLNLKLQSMSTSKWFINIHQTIPNYDVSGGHLILVFVFDFLVD